MISGVMGAAVAVVTAIIAVNSHFAHAEDVKEIAKNQREAIQVMRQNSARQLLFQLEFYDVEIRRLENERKTKQLPGRDIAREINDYKLKREFTQKQLIEGAK